MKEDQSMEDNNNENEEVEDKENWGHAEVDCDGKVTGVDRKKRRRGMRTSLIFQ
jgi:hypothetical protein